MVSRASRLLLIVTALSVSGFALLSQAQQSQTTVNTQDKATMKADRSPRAGDPKLYVGVETCVTCHEEIGQIYDKSPHKKTESGNSGSAFSGCEGCHGPGKAHAEGGGDTSTIVSFKNLSRAESTRICLDCHQQKQEHANFLQSPHARHDVGCLDCHSSHKARGEARLLKASQPRLCYGCHQEAKPDSPKPSQARKSALPVPKPHSEFGPSQPCTSCHSTIHGSNSDGAPSSLKEQT